MKKNTIGIILLIAMMAMLISGCSSSKIGDITVTAGESAIYIEDDGTVSYAICESFDKDYYDKGDLKDMIKEEIDEYNAGPLSTSTDSAELDYFKEKNDAVTAIIKFTTVEDFVGYMKGYNGEEEEEIFIGKISDALDNGYKITGEFAKVKDGAATDETAKKSEIKELDASIMILNEQIMVQMQGTIEYISANCTIKDNIVTVTDDETAYIVYK